MNKALTILTGEFFLERMPNGGKAVLSRSAFISTYVYLIAIAVKSYTSECAIMAFSYSELLAEVNDTIPWAGAIFGGVYLALYSRFSSQWSYLADLYNQQLSAAVTVSKEKLNGENYAIWQAAFIEDAVCMHLATKQGFSTAIAAMLKDEKIRSILESDASFGKKRVQELESKLQEIMKRNP